MAEASTVSELRYGTPAPSSNRATPNVSSGWIVMLLSGLIAAVVFLFVTNQNNQKFQVLVATGSIAPGQAVTASSFAEAAVNVDQAQLNQLISAQDRNNYDGFIATAPISQGALISKSDLRPAAAANGQRSISIPIDKTHAVDGNIRVGDRVDVVDEVTGAFAVNDVEVLSVDNQSGGALAGTGSFSITVAVTADQALQIVNAIKDAKFDVVLSTGATPIDAGVTNPAPTPTTTTTILRP